MIVTRDFDHNDIGHRIVLGWYSMKIGETKQMTGNTTSWKSVFCGFCWRHFLESQILWRLLGNTVKKYTGKGTDGRMKKLQHLVQHIAQVEHCCNFCTPTRSCSNRAASGLILDGRGIIKGYSESGTSSSAAIAAATFGATPATVALLLTKRKFARLIPARRAPVGASCAGAACMIVSTPLAIDYYN